MQIEKLTKIDCFEGLKTDRTKSAQFISLEKNSIAVVNNTLLNSIERDETDQTPILALMLAGYMPHHALTSWGLNVDLHNDSLSHAFFAPSYIPPAPHKLNGLSNDELGELASEAYGNYIGNISRFISENSKHFKEIRVMTSSLGGVVMMDVLNDMAANGNSDLIDKFTAITMLNSPLSVNEITLSVADIVNLEGSDLGLNGRRSVYTDSRDNAGDLIEWLYQFIYHRRYNSRFQGDDLVENFLPLNCRLTYLSTSALVNGGIDLMSDIDPLVRILGINSNNQAPGIFLKGSEKGQYKLRSLPNHAVKIIPIPPRGTGSLGHMVDYKHIPKLVKIIEELLVI